MRRGVRSWARAGGPGAHRPVLRNKLINVGTNRWAFKPEVGVSLPMGRLNGPSLDVHNQD